MLEKALYLKFPSFPSIIRCQKPGEGWRANTVWLQEADWPQNSQLSVPGGLYNSFLPQSKPSIYHLIRMKMPGIQ